MTAPHILADKVVYFGREDQRSCDWPIWMRVSGVRPAPIPGLDGEWMWVDGRQLALDGTPLELVEALVRADAVRRTITEHCPPHLTDCRGDCLRPAAPPTGRRGVGVS